MNLSTLSLENRALLEEQEQLYQNDPMQVDPSWRLFFEALEKEAPSSFAVASKEVKKSPEFSSSQTLIDAYRKEGHLLAKINPMQVLEKQERSLPSSLDPKNVSGSQDQHLLKKLQAIYTGPVGFEYMGTDPEIERFIQQEIETPGKESLLSPKQKLALLQELTRCELFERFLHRRYIGQKRFSLEGGDTVIPMLQLLMEEASGLGIKQCVLGMAHRGRLNVLAHILGKSYEEIFSEFEENYLPKAHAGSGDVKYHKGFFAERQMQNGSKIAILLCPNPSHLESVYPVVEGQTRALAIQLKDANFQKVLPIVLHGDGALAGQGVVYETLQMSKLQGYQTGGTVHIVLNNQVGFTTSPSDARSTRYCTDVAKAFGIPVFHLNCQYPEEALRITHLALQLRHRFGTDVFLDLNCYRKFGHNETDEPAFTQPKQAKWIAEHPSTGSLYRDQLIKEGLLDQASFEQMQKELEEELNQAQSDYKKQKEPIIPVLTNHPSSLTKPQADFLTAVPQEKLLTLATRFCNIPEGFHPHPKLQQLCNTRLQMAKGEIPLDWGMAETLALAAILSDGTDVRLSGQDCGRGTFSHRHGLWVDQENEERYYPLAHLQQSQGRFDLLNSHLSEYAALGFEFGYSAGYPEACVLWEAQFGDFANGAQIIIDQYIAAAEQKWGLSLDLVLLLPHGYEGQGPEHSSARLERFLSLCGNDNFFVVYPTTPAQLFHVLRRQQKTALHKPLVLFTPKGLLRHPACVSSMTDLAEGRFQEVIEETVTTEKISTLVLCSGRIYYDLSAEREKRAREDMTFVRLEQLYPLPKNLQEVLLRYAKAKRFVWVQEEPQNMGAWGYIEPHLRASLPGKEWEYVGRERSASPAAGYHARHVEEHKQLIEALFAGSK